MDVVIPRVNEGAWETAMPRRFVALLLIIGAIVGLFWPTFQSLAAVWVDGDLTTYTHGYLIAGIALWLLFRKRSSLAAVHEREWTTFERVVLTAVLLVTTLLWQFAYRAGVLIATQVLVLPVLWLTIAIALGRAGARCAAFPVAFLIFAVPVWDFINPAVRELTVHAVQVMLRAFGIPVFFSGNHVHIPEGVFTIADGCSGLHFLMVGLAVGALLGELRESGLRGRLGWLVGAAVLAILVNWIRVSSIVLIGHYSDMQHYIVRVSHYYYGWALFALALGALFAIERRIPLPRTKTTTVVAGRREGAERQSPWRFAVLGACAVPLLLNLLLDRHLEAPVVKTSASGWSRDGNPTRWHPVQSNADRQELISLNRNGSVVEVFTAVYLAQNPAKKLGGFANRITGKGDVQSTAVEQSSFGAVAEFEIVDDGESYLVWVSYIVGERRFTSALPAQLAYSEQTLARFRSEVSLVRAARTRCASDCESARATMRRFAQDGGFDT
jgi:exosortase A